MAFPRLKFTKLWTNPTDFPTIQTDENQVRADMQALHDETLFGLNKLAESLEAEGAGANIGVTMPYITGSTDKGTVQQAIDALGHSIQMGGAVPGGGTTGQVLSKASGADNDLKWQDPIPAYLSEGSILSNRTKEMLGLSSTAVADNAFSVLSKYNQHWWSKQAVSPAWGYEEKQSPYSGSRTSLFLYAWSSNTLTYADNIEVDPVTGSITLVGAETITTPHNGYRTIEAVNEFTSKFSGKYVTGVYKGAGEGFLDGIVYFPEGTVFKHSYDNDEYDRYIQVYFDSSQIYMVTSEIVNYDPGAVYYVNSSDRNAYPDNGESDGFKWEYLGVPFDNAVTAPKVEVISYVGTGTYGASNPVNLNFSFPVKALIFLGYKEEGGSNSSDYPTPDGWRFYPPYLKSDAGDCYVTGLVAEWSTNFTSGCGFGRELNYPPVGKRSEDGKSVSWYQSEDAEYMCNRTGRVYHFVAIG